MVEEKKKAILKSAEYLFSAKGFHETTVADIAEESGVHEASIYSYFNNKRNILFAIYGGYLQNAIQNLENHFQGMKEAGPKFRKSIWHYLADMQNNPYYAKILIMAQRENPEFYVSEHVNYLEEYSRLILNVIIAGQEEGFFRSDIRPQVIRNMGMGASVFTAIDSVVQKNPYDPNEASDLIYQLVINAAAANSQEQVDTRKILKGDRAEIRQTQIIENAIRVFSRKGFSNATISDVAKQANLGDATLYEYFNNKEAILLNSAEVYLRPLDLDDGFPVYDFSDTEKTLRTLIWRYVWQLYTHEDFSRVLVLELFRNINFYSSPAYGHLKAFFRKIEETVQKGQQNHIFVKDAPVLAYIHMIVGTFDQFLLSQFLLDRAPLGLAELNSIVDLLIRAIKVPGLS